MPKCKNCKKTFEAYSIESTTLPVMNKVPLEVIKLNCPVCGSMQYLMNASQKEGENDLHIQLTEGMK